jgi:SAM-dependent methyltransferase
MNRDTVLALNAINRAFYSSHAASFSATRQSAWRGFERAVAWIAGARPAGGVPRILDVGCGNARFAEALLAVLDPPFAYVGIDASNALLAEPRARHADHREFRFTTHDFVTDRLESALGPEHFHTILLLGVLHHVPGRATRQSLLAECAQRLAPGGVLVLTLWRFEHLERLRKRLVPWPDLPDRGGPVLDLAELEPGDHLLPFGPSDDALRYCHALSDDESSELLASVPLERADTWLADGETEDLNEWCVLRAPLSP